MRLYARYKPQISVNPTLTRALVSYQANRQRPFFRWLKYKEGFSAALIEYFLSSVQMEPGALLDPFAGAGSALFSSAEAGWTATGIELLPIGVHAIRARLHAESLSREVLVAALRKARNGDWKVSPKAKWAFQHLRITHGAFSDSTEKSLTSFRTYANESIDDEAVRSVLHLACLNVLEDISFTRKDGQYLRWDERANRTLAGKPFNKGKIPTFDEAITRQVDSMIEDLGACDLFSGKRRPARKAIKVTDGSCLYRLPQIKDKSFDLVITSPPYCNRYDYSRTYALELAYLGVDDEVLKQLRQSLLSCTVENREKVDQLAQHYKRYNSKLFQAAVRSFEGQAALQEVLELLNGDARDGNLNNNNIPRMVRNYFLEMSLVIYEFERLLRPGGRVIMVNDNVQYSGEEVPVDVILSDIAANAGLETEAIWTLNRGKGNSSQQMGLHGRKELRKCVYLWRKAR